MSMMKPFARWALIGAPLITAEPARAQIGPERVSIGSEVGASETMLHSVQGIAKTKAGIAILDAGNFRVLFFDNQGRHLKTLGREGRGPGEFLMPVWLQQCSDGMLVVWDAATLDWNNLAVPPQLEAVHLFGTDRLGRDLFARGMQALRISLALGLMALIVLVDCLRGSSALPDGSVLLLCWFDEETSQWRLILVR